MIPKFQITGPQSAAAPQKPKRRKRVVREGKGHSSINSVGDICLDKLRERESSRGVAHDSNCVCSSVSGKEVEIFGQPLLGGRDTLLRVALDGIVGIQEPPCSWRDRRGGDPSDPT